jgi:hypothetical protein
MKMFRENFVFSIQNISNSKASKIQFRSSFCGRSFTNEEYKCEMNVSPNMNTAKKKRNTKCLDGKTSSSIKMRRATTTRTLQNDIQHKKYMKT